MAKANFKAAQRDWEDVPSGGEDKVVTYLDDLTREGKLLRLFTKNMRVGDEVVVRFLPGMITRKVIWVRTLTNKSYLATSRSWDAGTDEHVGDIKDCPYRFAGLRDKSSTFVNVINRTMQEEGAKNPVQLVELSWHDQQDIKKIAEQYSKKLIKKGKLKVGKLAAPSDVKRGYDLTLCAVTVETAGKQRTAFTYTAVQLEASALTDEEKAYEVPNLEKAYLACYEADLADLVKSLWRDNYLSYDQVVELLQFYVFGTPLPHNKMDAGSARRALKAINTMWAKADDYDEEAISDPDELFGSAGGSKDDLGNKKKAKPKTKASKEELDEDDADEDEAPKSKKAKPAKKTKPVEEDEDDDLEDEDEDDAPKAKSKSSKKAKPPVEDDDDDLDDDDEEEDEAPKAKKGKAAKKAKPAVEEEDDDLDDLDDDDDDEDEPAPKKGKAKPAAKSSKSKKVVEDEDDDDEDLDDLDDDDDEEEEAPKSKKGKPAPKKKVVEDDDDDDDLDDLDDDDDEEEDEKPAKKSSKKAPPAKKSKKKVVEDEDDDDDDLDDLDDDDDD